LSANRLAELFVKNFQKFGVISNEIRNAGPKLSF
jgi:hypothetical protein